MRDSRSRLLIITAMQIKQEIKELASTAVTTPMSPESRKIAET